jgi:hypothetical protein
MILRFAILGAIVAGLSIDIAPVPTATHDAGPLRVVSLTLGNHIEADKRVTAAMDTFAPDDTIYAVVQTAGSGSDAKLSAAWFFKGPVREIPIRQAHQEITTAGDATTEFHVSKPDGWPPGSYRVEILLDDASVTTRTFRVVR